MDLELKKHNPDKVCRYQPEQSEETVLLKQHSWMFMSFLFVSFNPIIYQMYNIDIHQHQRCKIEVLVLYFNVFSFPG